MTVKETIRYMLHNHPRVFKNKWDCLHQLFMVNGNGYRWVGEELVDDLNKNIVLPTHPNENDMTYIKRDFNIIYPITELSFLVQAELRANKDWKAAAKEMNKWLKENYEIIGEENQKYVDDNL